MDLSHSQQFVIAMTTSSVLFALLFSQLFLIFQRDVQDKRLFPRRPFVIEQLVRVDRAV
jgi:hypothetical protein